MRLPQAEPALAELVATAEGAAGVDQKWGAIGPFLLTPVLEKHGLYGKALDPHVCYPIEPEQFWKPFLPSCHERVADVVRGATMLHLWGEAIVWSGFDFHVCPPVGSYLHERFAAAGALPRFSRIASEEEVLRLMSAQMAKSADKQIQHLKQPDLMLKMMERGAVRLFRRAPSLRDAPAINRRAGPRRAAIRFPRARG